MLCWWLVAPLVHNPPCRLHGHLPLEVASRLTPAPSVAPQWELLTWAIPWEECNPFQVGWAGQATAPRGHICPPVALPCRAHPCWCTLPELGAQSPGLTTAGAHGQRRRAAGGAGSGSSARRCSRPRAVRGVCGADPPLLGTAARRAAWVCGNHPGPQVRCRALAWAAWQACWAWMHI